MKARQIVVPSIQPPGVNDTEEAEGAPTLLPLQPLHPLAEFARDMRGNPLFEEWVAEMQKYRTERKSELATK